MFHRRRQFQDEMRQAISEQTAAIGHLAEKVGNLDASIQGQADRIGVLEAYILARPSASYQNGRVGEL